MNINIDSMSSIYFEGTLSNTIENEQEVYVLLSKSMIPNSLPIRAFDILGIYVNKDSSKFNFIYNNEYFQNISKGDTVYAISFLGDTNYSGIDYNPENNLYEFKTPNVKLSNVVNFIVP
jgi:hypothetical protein